MPNHIEDFVSRRIVLQICAEEGRYISGPCFVTVVSITNDSKFLTLLSLISIRVSDVIL